MPPKTPRQSLASAGTPATPTSPFLAYSFRDIVLAKVKGHPAWPARIIDPHTAPINLRDERKIAQKNSYLVKFFKTADYAWMNSKEMSKLEPSDIKAFIDNPNKKGADLKAAYQIALNPEEWEAEIEAEMRSFEEQDYDELEQTNGNGTDEASPEPVKKRKRNSEPKPKAKPPKKRKSEVVATNGSAPASTTPEPAAVVVAAKKVGRKKKEEPAVVVDGESTVRDWRHRLQRVFLGKSDVTEKIMPEIDEVFKNIEAFEMKTEWLTSSKLGKVLKRVGVLDDSKIPLDEKYHIRARARALQEKWRRTLGIGDESASRSATTAVTAEAKVDSKTAVNGDHANKENAEPTQAKVGVNSDKQEKADKPEAASPAAKAQAEDITAEKVPPKEEKMDIDISNGSEKSAEPQSAKPEEDPSSKTDEASASKEEGKVDTPEVKAEEKKAEEKSEEKDSKDDGEQMDCSESPEPEAAESAK